MTREAKQLADEYKKDKVHVDAQTALDGYLHPRRRRRSLYAPLERRVFAGLAAKPTGDLT